MNTLFTSTPTAPSRVQVRHDLDRLAGALALVERLSSDTSTAGAAAQLYIELRRLVQRLAEAEQQITALCVGESKTWVRAFSSCVIAAENRQLAQIRVAEVGEVAGHQSLPPTLVRTPVEDGLFHLRRAHAHLVQAVEVFDA